MIDHQRNSESSDKNSTVQTSQILTFGQLFEIQIFSIIKSFQIIHHDHKKIKMCEKNHQKVKI